MTLAASGTMSIGGSTANRSINVEFGRSATAATSMSQLYRNGGIITTNNTSVPTSGAISISNFYGAASRVSISHTFSANTANASLNVTAISGYFAGISDITVTVNSGVYLYSTGTGTPGLTLSGGTSGDTITVVNNGFIMGMGGVGGTFTGRAGGNGGIALQLGYTTTINNTNASAYIGGGGGGGYALGAGGRGAGGGAGGGDGGFGYTAGVPGGSGGGIGSVGADGNPSGSGSRGFGGGAGGGGGGGGGNGSGGGGGRIFPGSGGAGGSTGGGAGGSANNAGSAGGGSDGGGGGGWGAAGGGGGSSGGRAVFLNGYSVTWVSGDTTRVYGAVS